LKFLSHATQELRTVQITDDDEMEISDDERDYDRRGHSAKRIRYDSDGLKVCSSNSLV